jgi:D-arabinose 5-phosphate isomerase GutQ
MLRILPALARFQVRIIALCGDPKSTLAQNCDVLLDVNIEQEACPLNLAPTSSTTVMLALGDAIAMVLLEARGFQKEDFARFHPGGMIAEFAHARAQSCGHAARCPGSSGCAGANGAQDDDGPAGWGGAPMVRATAGHHAR